MALSAEQVAQLNSDIVWLVEETGWRRPWKKGDRFIFTLDTPNSRAWKINLSPFSVVAAGLVEGDLQQGSDIAKNATAFNRQIDHKDKKNAKYIAEQTGLPVEVIEDQMRGSSRPTDGVHPATDILATSDSKYDNGGEWIAGQDGIHEVQLIPKSDPEVIKAIEGVGLGYTWDDASRGIYPEQQSLPDVFEYPSGSLSDAAGLEYSLKNVDLRNQQQYEQDQRAFFLGVSSLAAIPAASFQVAANGARSLATGFGLGSAFDAVGQYLGGEDYRPMQTINAGVASAVAYPLAGAKYLTNVLWGGVAGGGSTVLNNFVYRENADVISSTLQGSVAGGLSTGVGSALGFFAGKYLPKRIGATIDPNKPILLQNRGVINPYPVHVETIFRDFSSGVINTGWNLRD